MKKILVACGTGIATSTVVAVKIKEICKKEGIDVIITPCKLTDVQSIVPDYDLLVTTGTFDVSEMNVHIIPAISLLTGVGEEDTLNEIIKTLKEE
ncbi:PTS sugar transporter subunit IIB [Clostridium estertheticum]|uniref:PTS sugar transporter subunit IIB n=1 Tax=Clostridium estertheticum TaxID=238834 RepID=UPI001C0B7903|nr:PTS sugar transporter subunit IIB [Clostridium estertheticum]MBU3216774.1 PTS sugar transporter subunit IIB [Clostridium estertheticum]WAG54262.1 PTS sugar transporter subunit IIB [Clostridium estertheticum]